jgi:hypothetical protein
MKHLKSLLLAASCLASSSAFAVVPTDSILMMASNYYAYPVNDSNAPTLTAAPKGYTPFHIEHYGRHGSRWLIGEDVYTKAVDLLAPAEAAGKLTPRGQQLIDQLRTLADQAYKRDGELTQVGADQHRGIARRMYANFPQVFSGDARVDARSTVVIRCILSMDNELQELKAANPKLRITSDASYADMRYMNANDTIGAYARKRISKLQKEFDKKHPVGNEYLSVIINDPQYAADSIDSSKLFDQLFRIVVNFQSHTGMTDYYDIFSKQELTNRWLSRNVNWFLRYGNSRLTDNMMPLNQRNLLRNIIESTDTAIVNGGNSANLRFGHDTMLLPLVTLMQIGNYGDEINDLEQVAPVWKNQEVIPMAGNLQIIFYRPTNKKATADNTLVKVLLNEKEMTLPIPTKTAPYYKWSAVRKHLLSRLPN